MNIGIRGIGTYIPTNFMTAAQIAEATGIPEDVIAKKFGVIRKPIPGPEDTPSFMGTEAARTALENSGIDAESIDLVIWNG
ncbi:MAG TPA: hypothetical protein VMW69_00360, partial [Spirochaetia bacterium]|nr:hypothetical protein [Spirochaetia bacterium]